MNKKGMNEFMELYTRLSLQYPLYMTFKYMHTGIPRWRIEVFGKDMANLGSGRCDMQVIHAEEKELEQVWETAAKALRNREQDLSKL